MKLRLKELEITLFVVQKVEPRAELRISVILLFRLFST